VECLSKLALKIARSLNAAVNTPMATMILVGFSNPTGMPPTAHNGSRMPIPSAYLGFDDMLAVRALHVFLFKFSVFNSKFYVWPHKMT